MDSLLRRRRRRVREGRLAGLFVRLLVHYKNKIKFNLTLVSGSLDLCLKIICNVLMLPIVIQSVLPREAAMIARSWES